MPCSGFEVGFDAVELLADPGALAFNFGQACADLVLGDCAVGGEIKQVLFLGVAFLQGGGKLLLEEQIGGFLFAEGLADPGPGEVDKVWRELELAVFTDHGVFESCGADVAGGAVLDCSAGAEEVEVFVAASADGALDDHAVDDASFVAVVAVQGAFEVVLVHAAPFPGHPAAVQ
ncbi:hypothetical protein OOZ51_00260 [Arthrobacter sp. MI7-26]|uniref:hypothetical protein n=1 Tax=Arthrobacter sp. MI7-26 TaxID=2993653 RepID=UPI0022497432|nr:hypothetical protein [Arthrobacter sp. MI7-26]MCX2746245.1 hypothetical protein [Arthrobacter sp. MI7-26]